MMEISQDMAGTMEKSTCLIWKKEDYKKQCE